MSRLFPQSAWAVAAVVALLLVTGVPSPVTRHETEDLLQGTWLREYSADGTRVRRILVLAPGGAFRESARVVDAAGAVTEFAHEGTWLYDGTNLKRKYTLVNG